MATKYSEQILRTRNHLIRLVTGKSSGWNAWWIINVDAKKLPIYQVKVQSGNIELGEYGKILHTGWGENPPADIIEQVEQKYG